MGTATERDYRVKYEQFTKWCVQMGLALDTAEQIDLALVDFMDELYLQGAQCDMGEKTVAAARFHNLQVMKKGGMEPLPRSMRALKGFRKIAPVGSRFGMPWEWTAGLIASLMYLQMPQTALLVALLFDTYLRPGEGVALQVQDVVAPVPLATGMSKAAVIVCPQERAKLSKVGTMDDTIILAENDVKFTDLLLSLRGARRRGSLFNLTAGQFKEQFAMGCEALGMGALNLCSYQLRHGGASRDALLQRRPLEEIRKRGRWTSHQSVRRYEKSGRVQKAMAETPPEIQTFCRWAADGIQEVLHGKCALRTPPGLLL